MKAFGWPERHVKWGMTGLKGWVYYNWAVENESSMFGSGLVRNTDGYVAQEINAIRERKQQRGKGKTS